MKEMSLSEAFRRRDEIRQEGKSVYFLGESAEGAFAIEFVDRSPRKPNWYTVVLKRDDDHPTVFNLPGELVVIVK